MSRILFIANCTELYGANRSMIDLAVGLQKLDQDVFFFIPQERPENNNQRRQIKKELEKYGFTFVFLKYCTSVHSGDEKGLSGRMVRKEINKRCLVSMEKYIIDWNIDIIHTNSLTHIIGALLSKRTHKPHVWHIREMLKDHYNLFFDNNLAYKCALRNADQIICISNYVRNVYRWLLLGTKVITLHDGFNVDKYILNGVYKKKNDFFNIILCGTINASKGQFDAVRAINYLVHNYKLNNVHLTIVGNGYGEYLKKIYEFISYNNINNYVDILPFQEDLRELRRNADIALTCSQSEALGRVTIESMLSENLVIGAESSGTAEIIENNVTGYLYEVGNAEDLCKKIYYAVTHWEEQERLIRNAKEYAKSNYDIEDYAKKVLGIYKNLISSKGIES